MDLPGIVLSGIAGYLAGSIPFGVIVGKRWGNVDVRRYGSGNIGATNVLRVLGPVPAIVVLACDLVKGMAAALIGLRLAGPWGGATAAMMAIIGHSFPVWLGFKGGKSVATAGGGLLALAPYVCLVEVGLVVLIIAVTRYVSLASISAAATAPFVSIAFSQPPPVTAFVAFAAVVVIVRHRSNIKRLLAGKENKLGQKAGPGRI
ncbi:MAG: glycerol-3-phosphate 1-O-acyltransferase PlsY [Bacillota bacterium]